VVEVHRMVGDIGGAGACPESLLALRHRRGGGCRRSRGYFDPFGRIFIDKLAGERIEWIRDMIGGKCRTAHDTQLSRRCGRYRRALADGEREKMR
jgi:hypothetical protein